MAGSCLSTRLYGHLFLVGLGAKAGVAPNMGKAGEHRSAVSLSLSSEATEFKGVKSKMDEEKVLSPRL